MSQAFAFVFALLFLAGFAESSINGWQTRAVAHGQSFNSFASGTLYALVWYIALRAIVENLSTIWVALAYALGSGLGSLCVVVVSKYGQNRRLARGKGRPMRHLTRIVRVAALGGNTGGKDT